MGILIGIVVFAIFIWLMAAFPAFRMTVLVIFGLVVAGVWWLLSNQAEKARMSRQLISRSEIVFKELVIGASYGGSSYEIKGVVKNHSPNYTLSRIGFDVTAYDCPTNKIDATCEIIGEDTGSVIVSAPPGQTRSFNAYLHFSNMPTLRNLMWKYSVGWIKAR